MYLLFYLLFRSLSLGLFFAFVFRVRGGEQKVVERETRTQPKGKDEVAVGEHARKEASRIFRPRDDPLVSPASFVLHLSVNDGPHVLLCQVADLKPPNCCDSFFSHPLLLLLMMMIIPNVNQMKRRCCFCERKGKRQTGG